jgi:cobalt/nickel transport protein
MRRAWWYVIGFSLIAVIALSAFLLAPGAEFGGADGEAEDIIGDIDPDYDPWVDSLWEVPGETESLLFALQAAIGASIIGFFIGRYGKVPGGAPEKVAE